MGDTATVSMSLVEFAMSGKTGYEDMHKGLNLRGVIAFDWALGAMLTLQDRRDIDDLYIRYCYAINELRVAEWVDCFTADGAFIPGWGPVRGEFRGADALAAFAADPDRVRTTRHWNANVRLWTDEEPIRATCYGLLVDYAEPQPRLLTHVIYHDVLVRERGEWRFAERRPTPDHVAPEAS